MRSTVARRQRPLNTPVPIQVQADDAGCPWAVRRASWSAPRTVDRVQDRWRIDDEWWRARPISRFYFALLLHDGTVLTIYHDRILGRWFEQRP